MKKQYTGYLAALAAILFSVLPSQAQSNGWGNVFWPASNSPPRLKDGTNIVFQSDIITSNIYAAIVERAHAARVNNPNSLWETYNYPRLPDEKLQIAKQRLFEVVTKFINHSNFPSQTIGGFISSLDDQWFTETQRLPVTNWTHEAILGFCALPQDFFEKTPPRNLAAHPSITWTNYAKYGWDATRSIITNLIYTFDDKGILFNEVYEESLSDIVSNEKQRPSLGGCGSEGVIFQEGPLAITELSITNYVASIFYQESANRSKVFFPPEYCPSDPFWYEKGQYEIRYNVGSFTSKRSGFTAALIGDTTSVPLTTGNHQGYSFYYESGSGPTNCLSFRPRERGVTFTNKWRSSIGMTQIGETSDGYLFLYGGQVNVRTECDLWSTFKDFSGTEGTSISIDCPELTCLKSLIEEVDGSPASTGFATIDSARKYVTIVQWDFTYK